MSSPYSSSPRRSDNPLAFSSSIRAPLRSRLRAFALPGSRACAAQFFLGCLSSFFTINPVPRFTFKMRRFKACFSKHSQWPPKSFRLARLES
ncbi:hypothetical protein OPV22_012812 [Ensete ventricosum]|uniref:Uncharacterized protein n=1 Tax=Ensete ventricosum TaxID=4639 RepID=A0AAV8R2G6_ENSVE|nr:hypothetical protein OPV22_012812 [Ensete ventricosum]